MSAPRLIAVMGPTASGKTLFAEALAKQLDAVILNGDAFQIYRGMDIGTAKPVDRSRYQLIDLKNPDEDFGVGEYVVLAANLLHQYFAERRNVIVCGGTGLYMRALFEQYKDLMPAPNPSLRQKLSLLSLDEAVIELTKVSPDVAAKTDLKNEIRVKRALEKIQPGSEPIAFSLPSFQIQKLAIVPPAEVSQIKIMQRTKEMVQNGWVTEVNELIRKGYGPGNPGFRALGYEAIYGFLQQGGNMEDLIQQIELDTVKYAKRQRTWLRAEPNLVVFEDASEALESTEIQVSEVSY